MRKPIVLSLVALSMAAPALAHPGHEASGFVHPFTGLDHFAAMIGVGMWAGLLALRRPAAALLVPLAFLVMMAVGAAAGFAGIKLPLVEAFILASVFVIGGLVMGAVRLPAAWAMVIVGLFAFFHGYAHAQEAPAAGAGGYILGFMVATAVLQAAGLALAWSVRRLAGDLGVRAVGGAMMAAGALVIVAH
ncbi:HupE/UreJ family protein [Reyranella sp.]|uniref:HupE/UreJ family protein n=1 Tax=Reyranella sp. TaxID=1929291 RepID=UPI003BA9F94F